MRPKGGIANRWFTRDLSDRIKQPGSTDLAGKGSPLPDTKQYSTGGKAKLAGISKRGNCYLRRILIHGARSVVFRSKRERIAMGEWMNTLEARASRNVLIVAMANKLARIAWAVLSSGQHYRAVQQPLAA
jgi:transposase